MHKWRLYPKKFHFNLFDSQAQFHDGSQGSRSDMCSQQVLLFDSSHLHPLIHGYWGYFGYLISVTVNILARFG